MIRLKLMIRLKTCLRSYRSVNIRFKPLLNQGLEYIFNPYSVELGQAKAVKKMNQLYHPLTTWSLQMI